MKYDLVRWILSLLCYDILCCKYQEQGEKNLRDKLLEVEDNLSRGVCRCVVCFLNDLERAESKESKESKEREETRRGAYRSLRLLRKRAYPFHFLARSTERFRLFSSRQRHVLYLPTHALARLFQLAPAADVFVFLKSL